MTWTAIFLDKEGRLVNIKNLDCPYDSYLFLRQRQKPGWKWEGFKFYPACYLVDRFNPKYAHIRAQEEKDNPFEYYRERFDRVCGARVGTTVWYQQTE